MLRINLLPAYVAQRRLNRQLTLIYASVFAAVVVLMLLYQFLYLTPADLREQAAANAALAAAAYITQEQATAASTTAQVAPIQANIDFVKNVGVYNDNFPTLYSNVARFTSPRILYYGMSVSGNVLTINAYTPSIDELGRYLQIMYHEPDITSVAISTIPTPDQAAVKIYYYKGVEIGRSAVTASTSGATSTTSILPGVPPGVSVTIPASIKLPEQQKIGVAGQAPLIAQLTPGLSSAIGGGTPADVYSIIDSDPDFNPKYFKVETKRTDGFTFTATCGLSKTFALPAVPTAGAASAAPAGPSGPNNNS